MWVKPQDKRRLTCRHIGFAHLPCQGGQIMLNRDLLYKTAENMGVKIDDDAFKRFDIYAELLFETNKKFNLTAITEPDDMTVKHFADCLSVFKYVDFKEGAKLIDVGTGAGFPGLVLLLARPDLDVTFLDGTGKSLPL